MAAPSTPEAARPGSPKTLNLSAKKRKVEKKVLGPDTDLIAATHVKVDTLGAPTGRYAMVVQMPKVLMGEKNENHVRCFDRLQEDTLQNRMEESWSKTPYSTMGGFVLDIDTETQYNMLCDEIKESAWGRKLIVTPCTDELRNVKPKMKLFYSEDKGYYEVNGTKTAYPFKPWLEQLNFRYQGGDYYTRHFAAKYMKSDKFEMVKTELEGLCAKYGWELVA